jgi:hypothetical protein
MGRDRVRVACQHEAAHAVTAWALGVPVVRLAVYPDGSGETIRHRTTPAAAAAISAAGDTWDREMGTEPYVDSACRDLARQVQLVGVSGIWAARRTCRQILAAHRREVLDLAGQLHRERELTFG